MSPEIVRKALRNYLEPRVKAGKGSVSEAADWDEAGELLGNGPQGWHLVIGWEGYDSMEDGDLSEINSIAWSRYYFIIERSKGLAAKSGADLAGLEVLIGKVVAWIRALRLRDEDGNEGQFEFQSTSWERVQSDEHWRRHMITARILSALSAEEPVVVDL